MGKTLLTITLALAATAVLSAEPDGKEWEDPSRMCFGREKTRAAFAPFPDEKSALAILPWKTPRQICLDSGTAWRFKWAKDPSSRPAGFQDPAYDVSSWDIIKVPCSWQAMGANGKGGWGTPLYTNVRYPFAFNPPRVMDEPPRDFTNFDARNPVGSYRRDFEVPADWLDGRVFLKFDGVDSFYYLWVNGKYVGFTKDSRCAAEFDVTGFVKPGKNTVALEVYRYSDGSYVEDQDMFRLSGIFRSVWLVRRPATYIRDFFARANPEKEGEYNGAWILDVETELAPENSAAAVSASLFTLAGKPVAMEKLAAGKYRVAAPALWSPETPNCYKLVLSLQDGKRTSECVSALVGFRESKIIDGRYCLNGKKVKLHGANRHETDPMFGHFCPRERQEEDVALLKRANCNIVRNSHYPQDDYWYYLCNLNGIALMDEANVECHGSGYGEKSLSRDPSFEQTFVWRNLNMVERNKNHPSILFWSHGNESGPGENMHAADLAVKARDTSRPTHYEGCWKWGDVDSNMYPSVSTVQRHADDANAARPYFICEYAHNMINAMGNLKDYQDAIESSDVVIGGCIWDWVDQGLYKLNGQGVRIIGFGGDWGDRPTDGQFVMNGCILSDRRLEPGYWEIKHVFQPVSATAAADGKSCRVFNKQFFRGLGVFDATLTTLVNGQAVKTQKLDLSSVPARGERTIPIPAEAIAANRPGNSVSLRFEFRQRRNDGYVPEGWVVADDQIDLPNPERGAMLHPAAGDVTGEIEEGRLVLKAGKVRAVFDAVTGDLASYSVDGVERLLAPMTLDAFRCPSSNEVGPAGQWAKCGWRNFTAKAHSFSERKLTDAGLEFTAETDYEGAASEELHGFGGSAAALKRAGGNAKAGTIGFRVARHWTMRADGSLLCHSEIRPRGRVVQLPRIGYRFVLPIDFAKVEWFGRGPFENYRDRKSGAFRGRWTADLAKFTMPYARCEDANNWEETDAISLSGAKGAIGFATLGAPFACQAIPYSPTELIEFVHPAELPPPSKVELGIFAETRGLGGASCGPGPLARDMIDNSRDYPLDFMIAPYALGTAFRAQKAELPVDVKPPPPVAYKVLSASSEAGKAECAANAVDGDPSTHWHTVYGRGEQDYPHFIAFDLGANRKVNALAMIPRQDGNANGRVKAYRIETSLDGKEWKAVDEGMLPDTEEGGEAKFEAVEARYLKVHCLKPIRQGQHWASFGELVPRFAE